MEEKVKLTAIKTEVLEELVEKLQQAKETFEYNHGKLQDAIEGLRRAKLLLLVVDLNVNREPLQRWLDYACDAIAAISPKPE